MKCKKEYPESNRAVSLSSVPRIMMEQLTLENISKYMKDSEVIKSSQHGFMKRKPCLTNLVIFYNEVITLVDEGRAVVFVS